MSIRKSWNRLVACAFTVCLSIGSASFAGESSPALSNTNWVSMEFPSSTEGSVTAATCDSTGNIYIGGSFKTKGDSPIPFGVAKWNGSAWSTYLSGAGDSVSVNNVVYSSGTIYAGGYFEPKTVPATAPFSFAKWNGTKWIPLGTDYGSFNVLTCDSAGTFYASGNFKTASGSSFSIGKWNGSAWIPLGTDYGSANALICDSSKNLYAGGLLNDGTKDVCVAKWNGTAWSSLGTLSGIARAFAFDSSGTLYAGGMFNDGPNSFGVAKWDGSKWNVIGGTGFDGFVYTLAFDSNGYLYAGGMITTIMDGVPAANIARWDGSAWSAVGAGTDGDVNALSYSSTAKSIYVGGNFGTAGDKTSKRIAKLVLSAAPGAPTAVTAERGNTKATVSFTAPASNGGFDLTEYEVTSNPEGIKATGTKSPIAVTRLTNGKSYTFTVKATNAIGPYGPASTASNAVVPATVPDAPTNVVATPGIGQASVAFTAPYNQGSAITGYTVTSDPDGILKTGTASPITVTGLTNGVAYTFYVTATNAVGTGDYSDASDPVTPLIPITTIGAISGTAKSGSVLTAGAVTPAAATVNYQWKRCETATATTGVDIGSNQNTYAVVDADGGKYIKVEVTGTGSYSGTKLSAATAKVPEVLTAIGAIKGTPAVGTVLTAGALAPATATVAYQWLSCDTEGGTFVNIPGAIAKTYTPTTSVAANYLKVAATGIGISSGSVTSDAVGPVTAPVTAIGAITGTAKSGSVLTAGALSPAGATVNYDWQTAPAASGSWVTTGITANTYTVASGDATRYIRVVVAGKGSYTGSATSTALGPVPTPITAIGAITGTHSIASMFSYRYPLTAGALTPADATATYQWYSCDNVDGPFVIIPGATAKTYTPAAALSGKHIKVTATGTGKYSGTVTSDATAETIFVVANTIGEITGTAKVGSVLKAGAVTPPEATMLYDWQTAPATSGPWKSTGITTTSYTVVPEDVGKYIKVVMSPYSGYIYAGGDKPVGPVPTPVTGIAISGTPAVGSALTAGALTPEAATVSYQWSSCGTSVGTYVNIAGATTKTYTPTTAFAAKYLKVTATGTGSYSGSVTSAEAGPVTAPVTAIGAITGTAKVGSTLTAGALTPAGLSVSYDWQTSSSLASGAAWTPTGTTTNTYTVASGDATKYIRVVVAGINGNTGSATSAALGPVPTPVTGIGTITGTPKVGSILTAGAVSPDGATVTYQWSYYNIEDRGYVNIAGATSKTYTPKSTDTSKYLRVTATGTGKYSGSESVSVGAPVLAPITAIGAITGTAKSGSVLTAGAVTPAGATVSYKWKRCDTAIAVTGEDIGTNQNTYTVVDADAGKYMKVEVSGTGDYCDTKLSAATTKVPEVLSAIGAITGTPAVGGTLTAGSLTPTEATATYQWSSCGTAGGTFVNIAGATAKTYKPTTAVAAKYLKVTATGTGVYSGSATSDPAGPVTATVTAIASITGSPKVGSVLTAGAVTPAGATVDYQWKRYDTSTAATGVNIGANQNTYATVEDDTGKYIRVVVTGKDSYNGSVTSLATLIGASVPGAPVIGTVTPGNARATVNFTAPAFDGGTPITSYTVTSNPGAKTATGSASPITVTGLTSGTSYTFTVKATNSAGTGPASAASAPAIPFTIPSVTSNPLGRSVMEGDPATFKVTVSGTPAPTCLWQVSTDGAITWSDLTNDDVYAGVTTATMTIVNTTLDMSRYQYRCKMDNIGGSVFSNTAILRVESYDTVLDGIDDLSTDGNWSAPTITFDRRGRLTFTGSNLEYTTTSPSYSNHEDAVIMEWTPNVASYTNDWEVQVDVHLSAVNSGGLYVCAINSATAINFLTYEHLGPLGAFEYMDYAYIGLSAEGLGSGVYSSYMYRTGSSNTAAISSEDATVKISFNSATKEFTTFYSTDGGVTWTQIYKVSISRGTSYDWGMGDNSTISVILVATSLDTNITPGKAYFSNFQATSP